MDISDKTKQFLEKRITDLTVHIVKLKKKRKIIKFLYYSSIIISVTISAILATIATIVSLPVFLIPILSTISAILTALSTKFNFQSRKEELNKNIEKLNKIKNKLDYVISCNGNLTEQDLKEIMFEFSL